MDEARLKKINEILLAQKEYNQKCADEIRKLIGLPAEGNRFGVSFDDSIELTSLPLNALSSEEVHADDDGEQLIIGGKYSSSLSLTEAVVKEYHELSQSVLFEMSVNERRSSENPEGGTRTITTVLHLDAFLALFNPPEQS